MPVFDFNHTPETEDTKGAECTYSIFYSDAPQAAPEQPILVLDTKGQQWAVSYTHLTLPTNSRV